MKYQRLSIFLLAALPLLAMGKQLSSTEAFDRALGTSNLTKIQGFNRTAGVVYDAANPAFTSSADGLNTLYVINRTDGDGFAIIAADDCVSPLLGYSDEGSFDPANISPSLQWWLSQYDAEIKYAIQSNTMLTASTVSELPDPIDPLIKTAWDQEDPFNDQCPEYQGTHAVTGCVATAMAQVMRYHKWPSRGTGSNTYNCAMGTVSLDFSKITFDWANMANHYNQNSSAKSKRAVAQLMYACGVSVDMKYNIKESSASSKYIPYALSTYFNYDKGMQVLRRECYYLKDWEQIIYNELKAGRPVFYDGRSGAKQGHQFICDGYNEGYYHFNWGWGGRSNGYYRLSALEPQNVGVGAGSGEYNFENYIIVGVQPNKYNPESAPSIIANGNFSVPKVEGTAIWFSTDADDDPGFHNTSNRPLTLNMGLKLVDSKGNVTYVKDAHAQSSLGLNESFPMYAVYSTKLPKGTYTVTPAFKTDDDVWHDVKMYVYGGSPLKMTYEGSSIKFDQMPHDSGFKVEDFALETPIYVNNYFTFSAKLISEKEYEGEMSVAMYQVDSKQEIYKTYPLKVSMNAGDTLAIKQNAIFSLYYSNIGIPGPGVYQIQLIDRSGKPLSDRIKVNYAQAPKTSIDVTDLRLATGDHSPADDIHITGSIKCTEGYFSGQLEIYLFQYGYNYSRSCFATPIIIANADETADFSMHGRYIDAKAGDTYFIQIYHNGVWLGERVYFTIDEPINTVKVLGDANGDNIVTSADAALTIANILELNPVNIDTELADMDCDGVISDNDLYLILSNALYSEYNYSAGDNIPEEVGEDFVMEDLYIAPGFESTFKINMPGLTDKRGVQFDLVIPQGLEVTAVEYVSSDATPTICQFRNRPDEVTRIIVLTTADVNFAADDYIKVTVKADEDFECTGVITLYDALADLWIDNDITESRASNAKANIVYDENQGINDIEADGLSITVANRTIVITSEAAGTITLSDVMGRTYTINLVQGVNRVPAPNTGIYFVGNHKIVVK